MEQTGRQGEPSPRPDAPRRWSRADGDAASAGALAARLRVAVRHRRGRAAGCRHGARGDRAVEPVPALRRRRPVLARPRPLRAVLRPVPAAASRTAAIHRPRRGAARLRLRPASGDRDRVRAARPGLRRRGGHGDGRAGAGGALRPHPGRPPHLGAGLRNRPRRRGVAGSGVPGRPDGAGQAGGAVRRRRRAGQPGRGDDPLRRLRMGGATGGPGRPRGARRRHAARDAQPAPDPARLPARASARPSARPSVGSGSPRRMATVRSWNGIRTRRPAGPPAGGAGPARGAPGCAAWPATACTTSSRAP